MTPGNTPIGTKRWSAAHRRFERFDGADWQPLAKRYRINVEQLAGRAAGNAAEQIPISNGKLNQNLNAEQLGGQNAAYYARQRAVEAANANAESRVSKAGDTLTGPLTLAGDATKSLQAVTKQQLKQAQHAAIPADGSVTKPKIAAAAVVTRAIAPRNVTESKLADGAASTRVMADGAVTPVKLAVLPQGTALNEDPFCTQISAWTTSGTAKTEIVRIEDGKVGMTALLCPYERDNTGYTVIGSKLIPVDASKTYTARFWCRAAEGNANATYPLIQCLDKNLNNISGDGGYWHYPYSGFRAPSDWTLYEGAAFGAAGKKPFPAEAKYMRIGILANYNWPKPAGPGWMQVQGIELAEALADRGAKCRYDSDIWAFGTVGPWNVAVLDLPDPWIITGLSYIHTPQGYAHYSGTQIRARKLRNQA